MNRQKKTKVVEESKSGTIELTLINVSKTGTEYKESKVFTNGNDLYEWAREKRPKWKYETR